MDTAVVAPGDARIVRSCSIRALRWGLPIPDVDADHSQEHVKEHGEKDRQYDGNQNHCQASPATAERADVDVSQTHDVLSSAVCTDVGLQCRHEGIQRRSRSRSSGVPFVVSR